jgi:hypothetical protein
VTEAAFAELARDFAGTKPRTLRNAVRDLGLPMDAMVEGVRQTSLPELARTLTALQLEYQASDDGKRRQQIRGLVIEAKAHARLAALRHPEKREMIEWMLVWLHDPNLFDTWAKLRMSAVSRGL